MSFFVSMYPDYVGHDCHLSAYMGGTLGRGRDDIDGLLIGIVDVDEHLRRRRAWNRGLSTAAVREYEGLIAARARLFIERLGQQVGEISLDKWINYFSYVHQLLCLFPVVEYLCNTVMTSCAT